jgi:hypothetical protein
LRIKVTKGLHIQFYAIKFFCPEALMFQALHSRGSLFASEEQIGSCKKMVAFTKKPFAVLARNKRFFGRQRSVFSRARSLPQKTSGAFGGQDFTQMFVRILFEFVVLLSENFNWAFY